MKTLIVILSVLFLVVGILAIGLNQNDKEEKKQLAASSSAVVKVERDNRKTMKQIDSMSSAYNYPFTKYNAGDKNLAVVE